MVMSNFVVVWAVKNKFVSGICCKQVHLYYICIFLNLLPNFVHSIDNSFIEEKNTGGKERTLVKNNNNI